MNLLKNLLKSFVVLFLLSFGVNSYSALQSTDNISVGEAEVEVPVRSPVDHTKKARLNKQALERETEKAKLEKIQTELTHLFQNLPQSQKYPMTGQTGLPQSQKYPMTALNEENNSKESEEIYNEIAHEMEQWEAEVQGEADSKPIIDVCFDEFMNRRVELQNKMADFIEEAIEAEIDIQDSLSEEFYRSAGALIIEATVLNSSFYSEASSNHITEEKCPEVLDQLLSDPAHIGVALSNSFHIFKEQTESMGLYYQFLKSIEEELYPSENSQDNDGDSSNNEEEEKSENEDRASDDYLEGYNRGYEDGYNRGDYSEGYQDGYDDSYEDGYDHGYEDGYNEGSSIRIMWTF